MAKTARGRLSWLWRGSPIGRKGPRKANPKYTRNKNKNWSATDLRKLRQLARDNTPTRVIGLKLGRNFGPRKGAARRHFVTTDEQVTVRSARLAARWTPQALSSRDFARAAGPAGYTAAHDQPAIFSAPRKRGTRGLSAFHVRNRHEPHHCLCL
jgi:hypothetical protein